MGKSRKSSSQKCIGCGAHATLPKSQAERKYCETCWEARFKQVHAESERFHFWRIVRSIEAEVWGMSHPEAKSPRGGEKVGDVWVIYDKALNSLQMNVYLEPGFDWKKKFIILFPQGISAEETYLDLLVDSVFGFFETAFPHEHSMLGVSFLTGEEYEYEGA